MITMEDLLALLVRKGGSDLHISVNSPPRLRIDGVLVPVETPPLTPDDTRRLATSVLTSDQIAKLDKDYELDCSFELEGQGRFRANVYLDLKSSEGFAENAFVGRSLRIGPKVVVAVLDRDPRCMMITLDPDTAEKTPAVLKAVAQAHDAGGLERVPADGVLEREQLAIAHPLAQHVA